MRVEVSFTPAVLPLPEGGVCVVIDVLRATSTLATMFARGLERAVICGSLAEARREAVRRRAWLLCGEKRSLPPAGFDYGNSPTELDRLDLRGKSAIFSTTNGTRALIRAERCSAVFTGAFVNVSAATRVAAREALRRREDLLIICAGDEGGRVFALEDAFCAGAMVDRLVSGRTDTELNDGARAALRLYRSYGGSALRAFRDARHGPGLTRVGLGHDVAFCAQRDRFRVVPRLERRSGSLLLRP